MVQLIQLTMLTEKYSTSLFQNLLTETVNNFQLVQNTELFWLPVYSVGNVSLMI